MLRMIAVPKKIICFPRQGLGGTHLVTVGVVWNPVSHTGAAQTKGGLTGSIKKRW